jgi:hypothetical protein
MPRGHYLRQARSLAERLAETSIPEPNSGCWLWLGALSQGYGRLCISKCMSGRKHMAAAHRISWQVHRGPIPAGIDVCHKCDNPACVNPDHLFLGTRRDNMIDCKVKGRLKMPQKKYGADHPGAKLTVDEVRSVRARRARGQCSAVAREFGVSPRTVDRIWRGESWTQGAAT